MRTTLIPGKRGPKKPLREPPITNLRSITHLVHLGCTPPTGQVPLLRENNEQPSQRGIYLETLGEAAQPMQPGDGKGYSPAVWAPTRWELLRNTPHPYKSCQRGEHLATFDLRLTHTGSFGEMHPPNVWLNERCYLQSLTTQWYRSPHRGEPLAKFGPQLTHNIPQMEGYLAKFSTLGRSTPNPPYPARTWGRGGFVQPTAKGWGLGEQPWVHTHRPPPPPRPYSPRPQALHFHFQGGGPTKGPVATPRAHLQSWG